MVEDEDRQHVAYRRLVEAIEDYDRACPTGDTEEPGLLIDWILVTASHVDHGTHTAASMNDVGPANQPRYRAKGLLLHTLDRLAERD